MAHVDAAEDVLNRVNGWAMSEDPGQRPVRLSGAAVSPEGEPHTVVRAGTAEVRVRAYGPAVHAEGAPQPEGSKNAKRRRFADVSGRDGEFRIRGWLAGRER